MQRQSHLPASRLRPTFRRPARPGRALLTAAIILSAVALAAGAYLVVRYGPSRAEAQGGGSRLPLPTTIDAILDSARTLSNEDDHVKAEAILSEAVRQYADNQELRLALANEYLELKKPKEAYEQYTAALSIGPRDPKVEFTAGTVASTLNLLDRAVEHYTAAQKADPTNADYPLYLGQVQAKQGQSDPAKASLLRAAKLNPDRAIIWGTLADIALRENNANLAIQHAGKARKLDPSNAIYRLIEARASNRVGKPEEALELLIAMPDADKRQPEIMKLMAESYGMLKRPRDAALLYAIAADDDKANPAPALEAGMWFDKAGDSAKAKEYLERAKMLGSDEARKMLEGR